MISQKYLKSILKYDCGTGVFTWLVRKSQTVNVGMVAGRVSNHGYLGVGIDGEKYQAHRLAWVYVNGDDSLTSADKIDHINHNRIDNRIKNLRTTDNSGNQKNQSIHADNSSGFCGVVWHSKAKKWQAQIGVNGKMVYLGTFSDREDAILARKKANSENNFHINHGVTK